ncbi:MAG: hypothetical protein H0T44_13210, partial [Gemmatimonadales bacterium]|nr:hypothetical protein [Gemmatimonadales bacterium]
MTPQEMQQLAELIQHVPGIRSIELQDVQGLAQLLRDSPEIGSIEVKGWFGTGVVITRTAAAAPPPPPPPPVPMLAPRAAEPEQRESPRAPAPALKDIKSPMVGTFYKAPEAGAESYVRAGARVSPG